MHAQNTKTTFTTVSFPTKISTETVRNLLIGLFENECSSWLKDTKREPGLLPPDTVMSDFLQGGKHRPDEHTPAMVTIPTFEGGRILLRVEVPVTSKVDFRWVYVEKESIIEGMRIMAEKNPYQFGLIINENDDATTADVLGQFIVYHEEIFC